MRRTLLVLFALLSHFPPNDFMLLFFFLRFLIYTCTVLHAHFLMFLCKMSNNISCIDIGMLVVYIF